MLLIDNNDIIEKKWLLVTVVHKYFLEISEFSSMRLPWLGSTSLLAADSNLSNGLYDSVFLQKGNENNPYNWMKVISVSRSPHQGGQLFSILLPDSWALYTAHGQTLSCCCSYAWKHQCADIIVPYYYCSVFNGKPVTFHVDACVFTVVKT